MSGEDSIEGATSSEDPKPTKCTDEEALANLEEHRCALCNKIIINASRIDCGHTFCRHCLNIHCESRNERGKPTCFICDAAVTEMSQNAERDKEIDKLYASLPVENQLRRAREKAERKKEEESFASRPKGERHVNSTQTSNDSFERGDEASYTDADGASSSWTEYGSYDDDQGAACFSADSHSHSHPSYSYSYWSGEQEDTHHHHSHHHHHHEFDFSSSNEEEDTLNSSNEPDPHICPHSPFHHPEPPIVIHHTVQHVFHTVHVQQGGGMRNEEMANPPPQEDYFEWNRGSAQCSRHREREHPSCFPQMPFPNYNCPYSNHNHSTGLLFAGPSHRECYGPFESPYHHYPSYAGVGGAFAHGHNRPLTAAFYEESENFRYGMDANSNPYSPLQEEHEHELYEAEIEFHDNGQVGNSERPCTACENLCEFHRAMVEQERRDLDVGTCSLAALRLGRNDANSDDIIDSELDTVEEHENNHERSRMPLPRSRSESFGGMRLGRTRRFQRPEIRRQRRSDMENVSSSPPPDT